MKNQKNGSSSPKMHTRAKLPITNPPKIWVSGLPSINRNGKLVLTFIKNQKNGSSSLKTRPSINRNGKLVLAIIKNQKNGSSSPETRPRAKLQTSLKFGSLV